MKDLSLTCSVDDKSISESCITSIKPINKYKHNIAELASHISVLESSQNINPEDTDYLRLIELYKTVYIVNEDAITQ